MSNSLNPLLAHLWEKNRPVMLARLETLERAAASPADPELREEAIGLAHKFAGSLGMFGFPAGTDLARALETGLEAQTLDPTEQVRLTYALRDLLFGSEP